MIFANGYANVRHIFEYIVFRYMIFINFSSNLLTLYYKTGTQTPKMLFVKYFDAHLAQKAQKIFKHIGFF
jgi:hypothetical protein